MLNAKETSHNYKKDKKKHHSKCQNEIICYSLLNYYHINNSMTKSIDSGQKKEYT